MAPASPFELLPLEILHHIFFFFSHGKPSNHLATGKIDEAFRGLILSGPSHSLPASDYYYRYKPFNCVAADCIWETIHMAENPHTIQVFFSCLTKIQNLEIKINFFGSETNSIQPYRSIALSNLQRMDVQIADLDSLRRCLEECRLPSQAPPMKSLFLVSRNPAHGRYVAGIATNKNSPIPEQDMYLAVFRHFAGSNCLLCLKHRPPEDRQDGGKKSSPSDESESSESEESD